MDKLVPAPADLSKLNNVIKNDVVTKGVYNAKIKNIEDKGPDITNLATKNAFNAKVNEVKGEISGITNLGIKTVLKCLVLVIQSKKTDYNTKINKIEKKLTDNNRDKYITTQGFIATNILLQD